MTPEPEPAMPSFASTWTSLPRSLFGEDRTGRLGLATRGSGWLKKKVRFGSTGLDTPCLPLQNGGRIEPLQEDTFALTWSGLASPSRAGTAAISGDHGENGDKRTTTLLRSLEALVPYRPSWSLEEYRVWAQKETEAYMQVLTWAHLADRTCRISVPP